MKLLHKINKEEKIKLKKREKENMGEWMLRHVLLNVKIGLIYFKSSSNKICYKLL